MKYIEALEGMPTALLTVGMLGPIVLPLMAVAPYLFAGASGLIDVPGPGVARMATFGGLAFCVFAMGMIGLKAHTRDPGV